jgi:hypothetical protein
MKLFSLASVEVKGTNDEASYMFLSSRHLSFIQNFKPLIFVLTVLQGMIDRLIKTGKCCRKEVIVEKTEVIRISREPSVF